MPHREGMLNSVEQAREKQADRERDEDLLRSGAMSPVKLNRRNGFFSVLPVSEFSIVSVGGRPLAQDKK